MGTKFVLLAGYVTLVACSFAFTPTTGACVLKFDPDAKTIRAIGDACAEVIAAYEETTPAPQDTPDPEADQSKPAPLPPVPYKTPTATPTVSPKPSPLPFWTVPAGTPWTR